MTHFSIYFCKTKRKQGFVRRAHSFFVCTLRYCTDTDSFATDASISRSVKLENGLIRMRAYVFVPCFVNSALSNLRHDVVTLYIRTDPNEIKFQYVCNEQRSAITFDSHRETGTTRTLFSKRASRIVPKIDAGREIV